MSTFWRKAGAERGEPLGDLRETRFGGGIKARAGAAESRVIALEHARLLGAELELVTLAPECVDAREQRVVEADLVPVRGELGRDLALDREQGVVAVRARERVKQRRDAGERPAAALQRRDRVVEARRLRIGRDGLDLGPDARRTPARTPGGTASGAISANGGTSKGCSRWRGSGWMLMGSCG